LLLISWQMTIAAVIVFGFLSWCLKIFSAGPVKSLGMRRSGALALYNQCLYETLEGMHLIRLKSAEQKMKSSFIKSLNEILEIQKKTGIYYAIPGPAMSTGIGVFICILLFIGASYFGGEAENFTSQLFLFLFYLCA
jgi:ABC-type multidrug transport system fused ATPase/permease subunit